MQDTPTRNQRLLAYARPYLWWYVFGIAFLLGTNLTGLAIPEQIGRAIQLMRDGTIGELDALQGQLTNIAWFITVLALGAGICRVGSRIAIFNAGRFVESDLRDELYVKLATLTPRFFGSMSTGDLTSRVANDVGFVRVMFAIPILHLVNTAIAYTIALQKMTEISVELTLLCLLPYPALLFVLRHLILKMFDHTKIVQEHLSSVSSKAQENLAGVAVIKAYTLQAREMSLFGGLNRDYVSKNMKLATYQGGMQSVMGLIAGLGTLIVLIAGASQVVEGTLELGKFVEFNSYVVALAFPTMAMGWVFSVWHRGIAAFDRIREVLDEVPDVLDEPHAPIAFHGEGAKVEFDNVSFAYGNNTVLHNISLTIEPGESVAFVGRTGSGKSTLLSLLSRFADPDEGEVRVDGVPLTNAPLRQTRAEFGVVPQGPFLFSMTIDSNLSFGLDALNDDDTIDRAAPTRSLLDPSQEVPQQERVRSALQVAGLLTDLEAFPDGLQTLVGERGITLSGGQKQRVTIARALLVDPRVLVLDDALSSVDTNTEAAILDHLQTVMAKRTSIMVTHRFHALHRFDRIFVLQEGRIVERGTHDELLAEGGVYATMYARQQLEETIE